MVVREPATRFLQHKLRGVEIPASPDASPALSNSANRAEKKRREAPPTALPRRCHLASLAGLLHFTARPRAVFYFRINFAAIRITRFPPRY